MPEFQATHQLNSTSSITVAALPGPRFLKEHPNWWFKFREPYREYFAEFLGVTVLVMLGVGANLQVYLGTNPKVSSITLGDYETNFLAWSAAVAVALWISIGTSGGHINPGVTLALATWRGFPWKKVPGYVTAQVLGAFVGTALVYANFHQEINIFEGGGGARTMKTAQLLSFYAPHYASPLTCFFEEVLVTAILMLVVLAILDKKNGPPTGLIPVAVFILVIPLASAFGLKAGYQVNPARDLGARLFTAAIGYGRIVFTYRNQFWLWGPMLGSIVGMQTGCAVYDVLIYTGEDSIVNKRRGKQAHCSSANEDAA